MKATYNVTCPHCGGSQLEYDDKRGEYVCICCGAVIENNIDFGYERRIMDYEDYKDSRVGSPITYIKPDKGLYTTFSGHSKLKWLNDSFCGIRNKKFVYAIYEINKVAQQLCMKRDLIENACLNYRKLSFSGKMRGKDIDYAVVALLVIAAEDYDHYTPIPELCEKYGLKRKKFDRIYYSIKKELNINDIPGVDRYMSVTVGRLNIPIPTQNECYEISNKIGKCAYFSTKSRRGLAGGVILYVCEKNGITVSKKELSKILDISEITIKKRKEDVEKILNHVKLE